MEHDVSLKKNYNSHKSHIVRKKKKINITKLDIHVKIYFKCKNIAKIDLKNFADIKINNKVYFQD